MKITKILFCGILVCSLSACSVAANNNDTNEDVQEEVVQEEVQQETASTQEIISTTANVSSDGIIDATDAFTERDLQQTVDLTNAKTLTLTNGEDTTITEEGIYVVSGEYSNAGIVVETTDDAKVQIVFDTATITNTSKPVVYVKNADKVFITTTSSTSTLKVTGTFVADGTTNLDGVIFSKDDVIVNGLGTLKIESSGNGIVSKDDLKITGSTLDITCVNNALEANDSVLIADGTFNIQSQDDGIHVENNDDNTVGDVYICGGTFNITAVDDAIHATTYLQVDDGTFTLNAVEALEATYVQINGGNYTISASDDGINATSKSTICTPQIDINGGEITISMGQGDTDAIDSNGYLYVNGGTLDITAQSPFDYDLGAEYNGGTMIVNGQETTQITNQMMGGGMMQEGMGGPGFGQQPGGFRPGH